MVSSDDAAVSAVRVVKQSCLALREQGAVSQNGARAVEPISQETQQSSKAIGETVQLAESLDALANGLSRHIGQFRP